MNSTKTTSTLLLLLCGIALILILLPLVLPESTLEYKQKSVIGYRFNSSYMNDEAEDGWEAFFIQSTGKDSIIYFKKKK